MDPSVLEYSDAGSGETLVLLPGGLTGWDSWVPLLPLLVTDHRVINIQLRANAEGIAGRVGDPTYTTDLERESVQLTLEAAGVPDRVHLVGWSNGGRAALDFAISHLDSVASVTVIEPAAWWLLDDNAEANAMDAFIRGLAGRALSDDDLVEFLTRAGLGPAGTDFASLAAWPVWKSRRNTMSWYGGDAALRSARAGLAGLETLDRPVLCIRGTTTAPWLRQVVDVLVRRLPNATAVDLEGGHACALQQPAQFVASVSRHVSTA